MGRRCGPRLPAAAAAAGRGGDAIDGGSVHPVRATDQDIAVRAAVDGVVATFEDDRALDTDDRVVCRRPECRRRIGLGHDAVVAEDHVFAAITHQGVIADLEIVGVGIAEVVYDRHRHEPSQRIHVDARVAIDQVGAVLAADSVVARSTGEVVARRAAGNRIVAGTAVDR